MSLTVIAKCVVINPDGNILVLRREPNDVNRPGEVDLPGGGVDSDEHIEAAVERELFEEAGLHTSALQLAWAHTQDDKIRLLYICKEFTGKVTLSSEHDAFWWQSPAEVLANFKAISWHMGLDYAQTHGLL